MSQKLPTFSDKISKNFLAYPPVWEPVRGGNDPGEGVGVPGGRVTPRRAGGWPDGTRKPKVEIAESQVPDFQRFAWRAALGPGHKTVRLSGCLPGAAGRARGLPGLRLRQNGTVRLRLRQNGTVRSSTRSYIPNRAYYNSPNRAYRNGDKPKSLRQLTAASERERCL